MYMKIGRFTKRFKRYDRDGNEKIYTTDQFVITLPKMIINYGYGKGDELEVETITPETIVLKKVKSGGGYGN